jgi:hypothetical protein
MRKVAATAVVLLLCSCFESAVLLDRDPGYPDTVVEVRAELRGDATELRQIQVQWRCASQDF